MNTATVLGPQRQNREWKEGVGRRNTPHSCSWNPHLTFLVPPHTPATHLWLPLPAAALPHFCFSHGGAWPISSQAFPDVCVLLALCSLAFMPFPSNLNFVS